MKISTKGRYGLRAMLDIAINSSGNYIPLSIIAERQEVSESYLEHVFATLRKAGLVKSEKGAQGGYALAGDPSFITVKEVLNSLEGDLSIIDANDKSSSTMDCFLYNNVWNVIDKNIDEVVSSYTLYDLVLEYKHMKDKNSIMYYI